MGKKLALCMYGQTRDFLTGYSNLMKCLKCLNMENEQIDVFFHTWKLEEGTEFEHASWPTRTMRLNLKNIYTQQKDIEERILDLYKNVKAYCFESVKYFDTHDIQNTRFYRNSQVEIKENAKNILSQFYSRSKVFDLIENFVLTNNVHYDAIISSRFDAWDYSELVNEPYQYGKCFVTFESREPMFIGDNFLVLPQDIYFKIFKNIYKKLNNPEITGIKGFYYLKNRNVAPNISPEKILTLLLIKAVNEDMTMLM